MRYPSHDNYLKREEKRKKIVKKIIEDKEDVNFFVHSQSEAKFIMWRLNDVLNPGTNPGITTWRYGRTASKNILQTDTFEGEYDCHSKHLFIHFGNGKSIEEIKHEMEISKKIDSYLPPEVLLGFEKQGDTSNKNAKDIKIICKLFNAGGVGYWYLYERLSEDIFMCYALLYDKECAECGTVSLRELAEIEGMFKCGVERDKYSFPVGKYTLQEVIDKIQKGEHV